MSEPKARASAPERSGGGKPAEACARCLRDRPASLVVFDLEFTSWEGSLARNWSGDGEWREVVQIGAVRLDPAVGFAETGAFEVVARPRRNPRLSDYFIALTGLTQRRVDEEGRDFATAFAAFLAFAGPDDTLVSNGNDAEILAQNCDWAGIEFAAAHRFVDIRPKVSAILGGDDFATCELPARLGLETGLAAHDALGDARAAARVLIHFQSQGKLDLSELV